MLKVPEYRVLIAIVASMCRGNEARHGGVAASSLNLRHEPASVTPILLTSPRGR